MTTLLPCVLCGRLSVWAVLCGECLARRCQGCGHYAGNHDREGRCQAVPRCGCGGMEVTADERT